MSEQNAPKTLAVAREHNAQEQLEGKLERIRDIDSILQDLQNERGNLSADVEKLREQINNKLHEAAVVIAGEYPMKASASQRH